jgi:UDP-glucose 4-epimerase
MSRILVTGGATPIGERLVRALLEDPEVEHVLAVGPESPDVALPFRHPAHLTWLQVDLAKPRQVHSLLFGPARSLGITAVVHSAYQHRATEKGRRLRALNVESTRELLTLSERHPTIRRFVYRSFTEVYRISADLPILIEEDHPLNLSPSAPQWIRDRVEADLTVCTRMGLSPLHIMVLRCAECLAQGTGSQLFDYLESPVCFRPLGFNPMVNLITVADIVHAIQLALRRGGEGVYNIAGKDTLPLASAVIRWNRIGMPLPGLWLQFFYRLRSSTGDHDFRYGMNQLRFHYGGILYGRRAREELGYEPQTGVDWPVAVSEAWGQDQPT